MTKSEVRAALVKAKQATNQAVQAFDANDLATAKMRVLDAQVSLSAGILGLQEMLAPPPVVPPVIPPVVPPVIPPSGTADILDVSFDRFATTAAMLADQIDPWDTVEQQNTAKMALDTVAVNGHTKAMRYDYQYARQDDSVEIRRALKFLKHQEAWAEFGIRWSPNFTTSGQPAPNDHKLIFGDTYLDESGRWAFYVGSDSPPGPGNPGHNIKVERPLPGPASGGSYYLSHDGGLLAEDLWDGNDHIIRLHFRHSTTPTSKDGMLQVWIDGILRHNEGNFDTLAGDGITGFSFCHNKDDGPVGVLMSIWWSHIKAWSTNPGW